MAKKNLPVAGGIGNKFGGKTNDAVADDRNWIARV